MTHSNLPEPRALDPNLAAVSQQIWSASYTDQLPWRIRQRWSVEMQQIKWTRDVAESERWAFNDIRFQIDGVDYIAR